ncbi:MAG: hypothetical protein K2L13_00675, partial [Opitutales bacterium]|nr:hypothetical protein [Opitutales bacterium]
FRVRLAIRTASGGIFFSPSNANSVYKQGNLTYKTSDGAADNVRGDLFFVDITVRALPNSCIPRLRKHSQKHHLSLNEIFPNHTCKSFRRIVIKGRYF